MMPEGCHVYEIDDPISKYNRFELIMRNDADQLSSSVTVTLTFWTQNQLQTTLLRGHRVCRIS